MQSRVQWRAVSIPYVSPSLLALVSSFLAGLGLISTMLPELLVSLPIHLADKGPWYLLNVGLCSHFASLVFFSFPLPSPL